MDNERLNILRLLIEDQETPYSIRQISIQRRINYKSAYISLKALEKEGVVNLKKHGNTTLCSFNHRFNGSVFTVESVRRQELLRDKDLRILAAHLSKLPTQFILLVFGSTAKGTGQKGSDIDLLLISNDPSPVATQIRLLPLPIHLTEITYAEFTSMLNSKTFTVVSEVVKYNVLLFGIEDYYRLMEHA